MRQITDICEFLEDRDATFFESNFLEKREWNSELKLNHAAQRDYVTVFAIINLMTSPI